MFGIVRVCGCKSMPVAGEGTHVNCIARRAVIMAQLRGKSCGTIRQASVGAKTRSAGQFQVSVFLWKKTKRNRLSTEVGRPLKTVEFGNVAKEDEMFCKWKNPYFSTVSSILWKTKTQKKGWMRADSFPQLEGLKFQLCTGLSTVSTDRPRRRKRKRRNETKQDRICISWIRLQFSTRLFKIKRGIGRFAGYIVR